MATFDPDDRLKGIATFVQVAEAGSFALAALRLRQTRSAVGKSVARLEARLGTRLFHRTTRRQSLTEDGQAFFERCKLALAELDAAQEALDSTRHELVGRLRVTVPVLLGRQLVAPLLTQLLAHHARLDLEIAFSDRVVDLPAEGFDLAVRIGALGDSATLAQRHLGDFDFAICASAAYLARHGLPQRADRYAHHQAVVYAGPGPESPWLVSDADGEQHVLQVQRRIRFDDLQAIADAAIAGLGLARLPRWLAAPHIQAGTLQRIAEPGHRHTTGVHAIWPASRQLPMKVRAAIDLLARQMPARLSAGA